LLDGPSAARAEPVEAFEVAAVGRQGVGRQPFLDAAEAEVLCDQRRQAHSKVREINELPEIAEVDST
jgi:hypothetical protein